MIFQLAHYRKQVKTLPMFWLVFGLILTTFLSSFFQIKLMAYAVLTLAIQLCFIYFEYISYLGFFSLFLPTLSLFIILNFKKLRRKFLSKPLFKYLGHSENQWNNFQRIDDGWFASSFERSIFQGKPDFISIKQINKYTNSELIEKNIFDTLQKQKTQNNISCINKLAKKGATSLLISNKYNGNGLSIFEASGLLKNISKINPVLSSIIGLMNFDSLTSYLYHFANLQQKQKFLPLISSSKLTPFLKPTSLYETLESQKSSIEGRIEKDFINGEETLGVRVSFQNIILLGTSQSNCFYINVNIKDFNNLHGSTTHLGTAICIINNEIMGIEYKKGLKAFDDYLYYYACSGDSIFIPFSHIINETKGIGNGLKYMYINQYFASNVWPLAVSIPTNNTTTLTSWYFAHLQKQNG